MNAKLTAKETALMTAIADRQFSFFDDGITEFSGIWTECMTAEIFGSTKYPVSSSQRGVASVVGSLGRKGLLATEAGTGSLADSEGAWTYLTAAGVAWCEAHTAETATETVEAVLVNVLAEVAATTPAVEAPVFAKGDVVNAKDGSQYVVRRINANGTVRLVAANGTKLNRKAADLTKA